MPSDRSVDSSKHAVYFRTGELAAILNYLRFQSDEDDVEPVYWRSRKGALIEELSERCDFRLRKRDQLEAVELRHVRDRLREVTA